MIKATLRVTLKRNGRADKRDEHAEKDVELPLTPFEGLMIESSVWHGPRDVKEVIWNLDEMHLTLWMGYEAAMPFPDFKEMYEAHEWRGSDLSA